MRAIEAAQRLAQLGATDDACRAYVLALNESSGEDFTTEMEAAAYLMEFGKGDAYKVAYTYFVKLYNNGIFQDTVFDIISEAFYEPNVKLQKTRYEKNCKLLAKYPYIFRTDFLKFENLPIKFFPYDDKGFLPFDPEEKQFGDYINYNDQVVSHNFFKDLEKPILAADVFSQYELEYLNDNVRKSEYIARENHIYLHYTSWEMFCAHLCVLNLRPLLSDKKFVFLIKDEISQYPIDFKERFGIDYSQHNVKPVGIREVNRIIWHTQLSSHNGGDFFNEIFDSHPNLLTMTSVMMFSIEETVSNVHKALSNLTDRRQLESDWPNQRILEELYSLRDRTLKDVMVAMYMEEMEKSSLPIHHESRIAPALFFQPHFYNINYRLDVEEKTGNTTLYSPQYETMRKASVLRGFKYIKTFTPLRRFTTSHAATMKFMLGILERESTKEDGTIHIVPDAVCERVLNRSFMIDWQDRLYKDSVLVRFEDGKLNPKATFTALAAFLDLPYTESMTYCSEYGSKDPVNGGNAVGFDPVTVYRTYDDYANKSERIFIEYFLRDAYEFYGYDFQYYDGQPMDEERIENLITDFTTQDKHIWESWVQGLGAKSGEIFNDIEVKKTFTDKNGELVTLINEEIENYEEVKELFHNSNIGPEKLTELHMQKVMDIRRRNAKLLLRERQYYNRNGQPLHMMPKLKLDPALLEQPLYH